MQSSERISQWSRWQPIEETGDCAHPLPSSALTSAPSPHPTAVQVKGLLSMPYQGVLDPVDAVGTNITFPNIPNEEFPSDHLAVGCQLSLCK